ncbi:hypothetical protein K439DRAFT_923248 [Ramaria rubella]|nr:hypothetical protein K439DRAFT_923248 [Ramaria rubella]
MDREPLLPRSDSLSYDDRFVTVDPATSTLTLKNYLLTKPKLHVNIPSMLYIQPASEVVRRIELKPQGLSLISGIMWARDWSRGSAIRGFKSGYEKSFVIKAKGDKLRIGFSVENPTRFLEMLEQVCPGVTRATMGEEEEADIRSETEGELEENAAAEYEYGDSDLIQG